jgi:regulator of RNase E activity RraA
VQPGDVIVGDIDGVLTIPRDHVDEIVALALQKVEGEETVRRLIEQGERTEDIFERTGIM